MEGIEGIIERVGSLNKQLISKLLEVEETIKQIEENEKKLDKINKDFLAFYQKIFTSLERGEGK